VFNSSSKLQARDVRKREVSSFLTSRSILHCALLFVDKCESVVGNITDITNHLLTLALLIDAGFGDWLSLSTTPDCLSAR
jgi:hypothetical protein